MGGDRAGLLPLRSEQAQSGSFLLAIALHADDFSQTSSSASGAGAAKARFPIPHSFARIHGFV